MLQYITTERYVMIENDHKISHSCIYSVNTIQDSGNIKNWHSLDKIIAVKFEGKKTSD